MEEWRYKFTHSSPRYHIELSNRFHTPAALSLGKESSVPTALETEWANLPICTHWQAEQFLPCPCGEMSPAHPARHLVTITRLLCDSLTVKNISTYELHVRTILKWIS